MDVFISYSSQDAPRTVVFAERLKSLGHSVWLDKWEIRPGHNVSQRIERGLQDSEFLILMVSHASIVSGWVEQEWRQKFSEEISSKQVKTICVRLEQCEVPPMLRGKLYVDGFPEVEAAAASISSAIAEHRNENFSRPVIANTRKVAESIGKHIATNLLALRDTANGLKGSVSTEDLIRLLVAETELRYKSVGDNAAQSEAYERSRGDTKESTDPWDSIRDVFMLKACMSAREHLEDVAEWKAVLDHLASNPAISSDAKLAYLLRQLDRMIEDRTKE